MPYIPRFLAILLSFLLATTTRADPPPHLLDGFEDPSSWKVITADGVSLKVTSEPGQHGAAARLDYDFSRGSGYAIIRKPFDLDLPPNYRFTYAVRGTGRRNTMEFKLVDPSGDDVWWLNRRDFEFPASWTTLTIPRRKVSFAWGPAGADKPLSKLGFLEIVITSSSGGTGTVWLDDLTFEPLPDIRPYTGTPRLTSSELHTPRDLPLSGDCTWTTAPNDPAPTLRIDFGQPRELGGLVLRWSDAFPADYDILGSSTGEPATLLATVRGSSGGRNYIQLPDATAQTIDIRIPTKLPAPVTLTNIRIMPPDFGDTANAMLTIAAGDAPRGHFPRYFTGQACYWTVIGADANTHEALIGEDGAVEVDKLDFSLEPFLYENRQLETWADATLITQSLEEHALPIPSVTRNHRGLLLETKAFDAGDAATSALFIRYTLRNDGETPRSGRLFIALRPFQVNPTYQNLNITGGAAAVRSISFGPGAAMVDRRTLAALSPFDAAGATPFDGGEILTHLRRGHLPAASQATDPRSLCSGAWQFDYELGPGSSRTITIAVDPPLKPGEVPSEALADRALENTRAFWRDRLNRVTLKFPGEHQRIADSVRANLAYILINRDGAGLQPGSRCYERTWIRDGALTSSALLAMGLHDEVRDFLNWFAPFQYDTGKIPCCVDRRGPDPVPEHDSHGEYIAAVKEYFDFTGDSDFLRAHWPRVQKAVAYIEFLRNQRMTDAYTGTPFRGLMPESISHEGYSAKPMHSYWDDFWTLKGLHDAADIAALLGDTAQAERITALHASFATTLNNSLALATQLKNTPYIPGCAELGDFDATSTTVALFPCNWNPTGDLRTQLDQTFDRYWQFFMDRRDGRIQWKDYTPYEHRIVGSMVLLGHRDRAVQMLDFFFKDQRPHGWNHWAEVVRKDPREQGYIGDMPHTWCGSDFINSVRLMLTHTRPSDGALILAAGLPRDWFDSTEGVTVHNLVTQFGAVSFDTKREAGTIRIQITPPPHLPAAGVFFALPDPQQLKDILVNDQHEPLPPDGVLKLPSEPCTLAITYKPSLKK